MKHSECGRVIVFGNSGGDLIIVSPTGVFEVNLAFFFPVKSELFT
jgi:hypothetical protein